MRVRLNADGGLAAPGLNADPDFGELTVDDGTGVALTTPTTAADIKGLPMAAGLSSGCTLSATDGSITINRPGRYLVSFTVAEVTAVNSQVITVDVYKNAAVLSPAIKATLTQPGTAIPRVSLAGQGMVSLTKNDVLTLRATADTGNFTTKRVRFSAVQLQDLPAATVAGQ